MTDKKLAKEYVDKLCEKKVNNEDYDKDGWILFRSEDISEAFLAGLNAGRPKWHDLRKDPNDLPKKDGMYLFYLYDKEDTLDYFCEVLDISDTDKDPYLETSLWDIEDVIAWCEIPKFEV